MKVKEGNQETLLHETISIHSKCFSFNNSNFFPGYFLSQDKSRNV